MAGTKRTPVFKEDDEFMILRFLSLKDAVEYESQHPEVHGHVNHNDKSWCVRQCSICGKSFWGQSRSMVCSPECRAERSKLLNEQWRKEVKLNNEKKQSQYIGYTRISYANMPPEFKADIDAMEAQEKLVESNKRVYAWNERHCCPFFEGKEHGSLTCFYCKRGKNYAGVKELSNRRCPDMPIAWDGSRYVQRAAYGKDANKSGCLPAGKRYDYTDNLSEQLKVQLVERMRKVGRELYIWSNGHVDTTPEPNSNC